MKDTIHKYVLKNAHDFDGKANSKVVLGLVLRENPKLKKDVPRVAKEIQKAIHEVERLTLDEIHEKLRKIDPKLVEKQEKKKADRHDLPPLKNAVEGKVITRIAPEPSKYNHLGHAVSFLLNYMYSVRYKGKCVLRFEDTNPEKSSQEYVDAMKADVLDYLGIKTSSTAFVSDNIPKYYKFAEQLIKQGKAYTCLCESKDISQHRRDMTECSCRSKEQKDVEKEWKEMKQGKFQEGKITLRIKIDMEHKNAVMRDPVIFRLSEHRHYRQDEKYKVWPMYDFENAIEEGLMKITHVLRSNEFESRIELQDHIRNLFDLPNPEVRQYARFNLTGSVTQGREIRKLIETGNYVGWDDPRLVTLRALKRRGIVKDAFYELAKRLGMSKTTSNVDFSVLSSINRKLLDESASRFYFIDDPVKVSISQSPKQEVELDLHPHHNKGGRKFSVKNRFYISQKDINLFQDGEIIRLIGCVNFRWKDKKCSFDSIEMVKKKKIHWLPADDVISVEVMMPDCTILKGLAEKNIQDVKVGDVIQFERMFFARLDKIEKDKYTFWFTHE